MSILKADFTRDLVLSFASRLKLPSMFIVLKKKKKRKRERKRIKKNIQENIQEQRFVKVGFGD